MADMPFIEKKCLAQGGYGIVYLVEHKVHGKVAFKKIEVSNAKDEDKFQNELKIHEGLDHGNIVKLLGNHAVSTTRGLFLEYLENGNVNDLIEKFVVSWQWKTQIIYDVSLAMSYLHSQHPSIIHGDLKPDNILIDGVFRAKVSDFGFACFESETGTTGEPHIGTLPYVAPECLENPRKQKTIKFDVYGYAISVWEIFSEKRHANDYEVRDTISEFVIRGTRPTISSKDEIPYSIVEMLGNCWGKLELNRPKFEDIASIVSSELNRFENDMDQPVQRFDSGNNNSENPIRPVSPETIQIVSSEDRIKFIEGFHSVWLDLTKYIDCENGLLASMTFYGVITSDESKGLDDKTSYRDRNDYMLMHYIKPRIIDKCSEFVNALNKNEQGHVVKFIFTAGTNKDEDRLLTDEEIRIIDRNMFGLINLINPYKHQFLHRLVSRDCITNRHKDKVESHRAFSDSVDELLTILKRRRCRDLCCFKLCLNDTMQNRIVELLEKSGLVAIRVKLQKRPDITFIESALVAHLTDYVEGNSITGKLNAEQRQFVDSVLKDLEKDDIRLLGNSTWRSLAVFFFCESTKSLKKLKVKFECGALKRILERVYRALFKSPDSAPDLIKNISLYEYPFQSPYAGGELPITTAMEEIVWAGEHTMQGFVDKFSSNLPVLVKTITGYGGLDDLHQIGCDEIYWVYDIQRQKRIVTKVKNQERYLSIPVDHPMKFQLIQNNKRSAAMSLAKAVNEMKRDDVEYDQIISANNESLSFQIGADPGNKAKFGAMEIIDTYDEKYLLGYPISNHQIHSNTFGVPVYIDVEVDTAVGFKTHNLDAFYRWINSVKTIANQYPKTKVDTCKEIILFTERPHNGTYEYINPNCFRMSDEQKKDLNFESIEIDHRTQNLYIDESTRPTQNYSGKQSVISTQLPPLPRRDPPPRPRPPAQSAFPATTPSSRLARCQNVNEIPSDADVQSFTMEDVMECLRLLNMSEFIESFRLRQVDGSLLLDLDTDILVSDFGLSEIDALRLMKFANTGWRPV